MSSLTQDYRERILDYLKSHVPFQTVQQGLQLANSGAVSECSKSGDVVYGVIKDSSEAHFAARLNIVSAEEIDPNCACITDEPTKWCMHAVALLWRACDLGFFEPHVGFPSPEATYRMILRSPAEIAEAIRDLRKFSAAATPAYFPDIKVLLDFEGDRLGIQVLFDDEIQVPNLFETQRKSSRALDNLFLQILDDEGTWDEAHKLWVLSSAKGLELVLGLLKEFATVKNLNRGKRISFSDQTLDARLCIDWLEAGVELSMYWRLADGQVLSKDKDVFGTGPFWTIIDHTVYKLGLSAARIASIFGRSSQITLPRSQIGPILEALNDGLLSPELIEIKNKKLQPQAQVREPKVRLYLDRVETPSEHFSSTWQIQLTANLEFEYPEPPTQKNIVYLPDRSKEKTCQDLLRSLSFDLINDKGALKMSGNPVLDFLSTTHKEIPTDWEVHGLESCRKSVRFANLTLNVALSEADAEKGFKSSQDWFQCDVSLVQNNANVPVSSLFKHVKSDADSWVKLDSGAFARVPGGSFKNLQNVLGVLDPNYRLSNSIRTKVNKAQAIGLSRIQDGQFNISAEKHLQKLSRVLDDFTQIKKIKPSASFKGKLRSYQEEGLSWLFFLRKTELNGILADEMGLGKTVQTLALFQYLKDSKISALHMKKPALVIAPTSVITNWYYEAMRFAPKLKTLVLHGPQRKKHFSELMNYDLIITSYALLRLDRQDLERHSFSYCVLDEAQNIKNYQTATTQAAKSLNTQFRLALSGTPTENRPMELWSILDFLMPGYLGTPEFFRNNIERPILEQGVDVSATKFLQNKIKPFVLRRTKAEVEKDLPAKLESIQYVSMTDSQRNLYTAILEEVKPKVFDAINKKGVRGASISILTALLRLRQICNHPNSIDAFKQLEGYDSGKFNLLQDLITEALENGRKILVFCQFKEMLSIIRNWLDKLPYQYQYLDGATRNRQQIIDKFNLDEKVRLFLISLKAGGTGLNLTAADTVIIYDPWWNPAVENQAVDRAHRIGQTKTVTVYRLVTENSVEQKIMKLKEKKAKIVEALINEGGLSSLALSVKDLENLFSIDSPI